MSQVQIAEAIGITQRVWLLAENGSTPRPENAKRIADYFGVEVTDLWPPIEPEKAVA